MDELGLFTVALGLSGPWRVTRTEFDPQQASWICVRTSLGGAGFACRPRTAP